MALNAEELAKLRLERDALKAEKEAAELKSEIESLKSAPSKVEVVNPSPEKIVNNDLIESAKANDFQKWNSQLIDLQTQVKDLRSAKLQKTRENRKFQVSDLAVKSFGSQKEEIRDFAEDFVKMAPTLDLLSVVLKKPVHELKTFKRYFAGKGAEHVQNALKAISMTLQEKALYSTGAGLGDEFVPTIFNDVVWERLHNLNVVMSAFGTFQMPSNPFRWPLAGNTLPSAYYVTESTTDTGTSIAASDTSTSNKDFDAKLIAAHQKFTMIAEEDSIIPIVGYVEADLAESLMNGVERAVVFGDTVTTADTNINTIVGTPVTTAGAADVFLALDGLIKNCFGSNGKTASLASDIVTGFGTAMAAMGVGAIPTQDCIALSNVALAFAYMKNSNFTTVQNLGAKATLLNGMVGAVFGCPLVPTSGIPLTNAAGKIEKTDPTQNTKGTLLIARRRSIMIGVKRQPGVVEEAPSYVKELRTFVSSIRLDVKVMNPNQSDRASTAYGYNATV